MEILLFRLLFPDIKEEMFLFCKWLTANFSAVLVAFRFFSLLLSHLTWFPYPLLFYFLNPLCGLKWVLFSAPICSVSLQWCGRTHLTSLYCSFILHTGMQCWFTKKILTQIVFFVVALVFHVSKKTCFGKFR